MNPFFSNAILAWFREHGRALPWRATHDPYPIWLSEIILQQTRINQGWEYWKRFMRRFPKVGDLAAASEDEVLRLWQGLGYYSRARNLHAAAKQIVALGHFPDTLEEIKQLKGVGDYTAAAIASFAFNIPAAVVDGNVYRVLARYFCCDMGIDTTQGKKFFLAMAQDLLPHDHAADYNQAIMDFGALQCKPQSPKCESCPLQESCGAFRANRIDELPVKEKSLQVKTRRLTYIYIRCNGETALRRRGKGDIWQGLWEPYNAGEETQDKSEHESDDRKSCGDNGGNISLSPLLLDGCCQLVAKDVKHVLTHRILLADFYLLETASRPSLPADYIWIREEELGNYGIPRLIERLVSLLPGRVCV